MGDVDKLETIYSALKALGLLRANVTELFNHITNRSQVPNHADNWEQTEPTSINDYVKDLQSLIDNLSTRFRYVSPELSPPTLTRPLALSLNPANWRRHASCSVPSYRPSIWATLR